VTVFLVRVYWAGTAAYALVLGWAFLSPWTAERAPRSPWADEAAHAAAFGLLAALLAWGLRVWGRRGPWWAPVLVAGGYGFALELGQRFIPQRTFAWSDAGMNVLGAALGAAIVWVLLRMRRAQR
jgi:VanZ family protein